MVIAMPRIIIALIFCFISLSAHARGNGHNTIFDPNSMGGGWTCFTTSNCGGATTANFGATCDGVADDSTAMAAWTAYAVAQNPAVVKLYIPPGSKCLVPSNHNITFDGDFFTGTPINNAIIWGYRASFDYLNLGGSTFIHGVGQPSYLTTIDTVSSGATSVVVNGGNLGVFSAGDWMMVTGDCVEAGDGGYPPNFQFYDTVQITGISGNTVSFTPPLGNSYKSTWPVCSLGEAMGNAGPATIIRIAPTWNSDVTIYGISILNNLGNAINAPLKALSLIDVQIYDLVGTANLAPSGNLTFRALYSRIGGGFEIDKTIQNFYLGQTLSYGVLGGGGMQSASPKFGVIEYTTFWCNLGGTSASQSLTLSHLTILTAGCDGRLVVGGTIPLGAGNSLTVADSTFPVAVGTQQENLVSDFTYSAGTFTMSKSAAGFAVNNWFAQFVPGFSLKFGYHNGGSGTCTPAYSWKVLDISENVSNLIAPTTGWKQDGSPIATPSVLPTPTCPGTALIVSYPFATITQTNTGSSPDITQFAAP